MTNISSKFLSIKNEDDLCSFFNIKKGTLNYYCKNRSPQMAYSSFSISKKAGGERVIYAPNTQLKCIQKKISKALYEVYAPKKISHGFINKRSIVTNADIHKNKRWILNIDLENFFDSIHIGRVRGLFKSYPFNFPDNIARLLSQLVCRNLKLPQGSPCSPIITNFICRGMDAELIKLTSKYKVLCTRYCDDITFSTKAATFPDSIAEIDADGNVKLGKELLDIISQNSFSANKDKTRLQHRSGRQMVTGLVVNEKPNILRKKYKKFRAILYSAYINDIAETAKRNGYYDVDSFCKYLKGTINFYKMVLGIHDGKYQYLAKKYNEIFKVEEFEIPSTLDTLIANSLFVIESEYYYGTAFYIKDVGVATCLHTLTRDEHPTIDLINTLIKNKYIRLFNPSQKSTVYDIIVEQIFEKEDLVLMKITNINLNTGFELASKHISLSPGKSTYGAVGYPDYTPTSGIWLSGDFLITHERTQFAQNLKIVNTTFYIGSSGGPVFDKNYKVVGYIDRGNEFANPDENYNAFCSIKPLIKYLETK